MRALLVVEGGDGVVGMTDVRGTTVISCQWGRTQKSGAHHACLERCESGHGHATVSRHNLTELQLMLLMVLVRAGTVSDISNGVVRAVFGRHLPIAPGVRETGRRPR